MSAKFQYTDVVIHEGMVNENKSLRLEQLYELCVKELGLQQSKRDQTIAFYIGVLAFVIPAIIDMDTSMYAKGAGFLALYVLGVMLVRVIMRYRVYKEVYWITSRTITQLFQYKENKINKVLIQSLFYKNLEKNANTVLVITEKKVKRFKTFRKIQNSAETALYNVMVLMSSLVLWIAAYMLIPQEWCSYAIATGLVLVNFVIFYSHYYKQLTRVYRVVLDGKDSSFNAVFSKAWFLHIY